MPAKKSHTCDIIIIGGGIGGLSLACLLGGAGFEVRLIETRKPGPLSHTKPGGRTVALMQSSLNILKAAGLANINRHGTPMRAMRIIDDSIKGERARESLFEAQDIGLDAFSYNIPNTILAALLYERAKEIKTISIHAPERFSGYRLDGPKVTATTESGLELAAPLLIGADGRNSPVRTAAGIKTQARNYHQNAITCLIGHARGHENIATEFHRPGGPLALVPLDGNTSSIVWVEPEQEADMLLKLRKNEFETALQNAGNNLLGKITLESDPESWPLQAVKAKALTAERMALCAEAAHVLSPITAQGLNLSLRDIAALSETLTDAARAGQDWGNRQTLKTYKRRRGLDINTRFLGTDSLMRLVSNDVMPLKRLRRGGLKALDALAPLKKFAMTQGLAPPTDQGRLARGESL